LSVLTEVLERRVTASGGGPDLYLERIDASPRGADELRELARQLTVSETYFFRHFDQFRAYTELALPERFARATAMPIHVLSAGCSSGEEAYSLAILARERGYDLAADVQVHAIDVNPAMLEKAARGRYAGWALRETPPNLKQRWFEGHG